MAQSLLGIIATSGFVSMCCVDDIDGIDMSIPINMDKKQHVTLEFWEKIGEQVFCVG